MIVLSGKKDNL